MNKVFKDYISLVDRLINIEGILSRENLIRSEHIDDYWNIAFNIASLITRYKSSCFNTSDSVWDHEDYKMELTCKIVDKYEALIKAYMGNPSKFNPNAYISCMLIKMILDNKEENSDHTRVIIYSLESLTGEEDNSVTLENYISSDDNTEDECIHRSNTRDAFLRLAQLSSKGPLYAFILTLTGQEDSALKAVRIKHYSFIDVYNNILFSFCDSIGINDPNAYQAVSENEFGTTFSSKKAFNSPQISRWKYMCRNELGPLYGIDVAPKQRRNRNK